MPSKSWHQENRTEEDRLCWKMSSVTVSIIAIAHKESEYTSSHVGEIQRVIISWTQETKHCDIYM